MRIQGHIIVTVDEVDIEQLALHKPELLDGLPSPVNAGLAAIHKEDVAHLVRYVGKFGQEIVFEHANQQGNRWHVTFRFQHKDTRLED